MKPATIHTGGCQCGAIRFRVEGTLGDASVCHCRMCQKAFGGFYAPLVNLRDAKLAWTRGAPKKFQSSNAAMRGFCENCGTPLTYEAPDGLAIAIGAFDQPQTIVPELQWGAEAELPYMRSIPDLPRHGTLEDVNAVPFLKSLVSYQHPDHDTDIWPPE